MLPATREWRVTSQSFDIIVLGSGAAGAINLDPALTFDFVAGHHATTVERP
ncbi:hypothetical protein [Roseinatronobacter sp.]